MCDVKNKIYYLSKYKTVNFRPIRYQKKILEKPIKNPAYGHQKYRQTV